MGSALFAKNRGVWGRCLGNLLRSATQRLGPSGEVYAGASKSFSCYLFADPHPLSPAVSILYKNSGGGGPGHTRAPASNLEPLTTLLTLATPRPTAYPPTSAASAVPRARLAQLPAAAACKAPARLLPCPTSKCPARPTIRPRVNEPTVCRRFARLRTPAPFFQSCPRCPSPCRGSNCQPQHPLRFPHNKASESRTLLRRLPAVCRPR